MHPLRRADDRVDRACLDAQRAADARALVDARDVQRARAAPRDVSSGGGVAREQPRERGERRVAARRAAVDVGGAARDRLRVRPAAGVPAARALRLRQQVVDPVGKVGRVGHGGAILASGASMSLPTFATTIVCTRTTAMRTITTCRPMRRRCARLARALALTGGFAIVEAVGGWLAGSLALLSDAGHMATDAAALGLALFAQWVARRPPSPRASYGYARAEVLAAFVNALALLLLVGFIVVEAIARIAHPAPVAGGTVLAHRRRGARDQSRHRVDAVARGRRRPARTARCCTCCPMRSGRSPRSSRAP